MSVRSVYKQHLDVLRVWKCGFGCQVRNIDDFRGSKVRDYE